MVLRLQTYEPMLDPVLLKYQLRDAAVYWILIPAAVIVSGKSIDLVFGWARIPLSLPMGFIAVAGLAGGLLLISRAMRDLTSGGGTPNPLRPPKKIITTGCYSVCRHPLFLGYDLCALAVVFLWGSPGMLLVSYPLFLLLEVRFLRREEKVLLLKFKQAYAEYMARTPFLLPFTLRRKKEGRQP